MRNVEANIETNVSAEKVILAFTDAELLRGWWGVEKTLIELKPGGVYTLAWAISGQGIKYISTGIIKEYDPYGLMHIEKYSYLNPERSFLGPQELTVKAIANGNGSRVYLTQGLYPENTNADWDWFYEAVVNAWPQVLQSLKKFLE
jgi:uncharacterized protein YndB with AHSA1/START domain